jgi:hypothetical protein
MEQDDAEDSDGAKAVDLRPVGRAGTNGLTCRVRPSNVSLYCVQGIEIVARAPAGGQTHHPLSIMTDDVSGRSVGVGRSNAGGRRYPDHRATP